MIIRFKQFIEAWASDATGSEYQSKIDKGKARESSIMKALRSKYEVNPASGSEDIRGIDCYIKIKNELVSTQIKTAEGDRVRFQIKTGGQPSKEMNPTAKLYAYYIPRNGVVYFIESSQIKKMLNEINQLIETRYKQKLEKVKGINFDYKGDEVYVSISHGVQGINTDAYFKVGFIDSLPQVLPPFRLSL